MNIEIFNWAPDASWIRSKPRCSTSVESI